MYKDANDSAYPRGLFLSFTGHPFFRSVDMVEGVDVLCCPVGGRSKKGFKRV